MLKRRSVRMIGKRVEFPVVKDAQPVTFNSKDDYAEMFGITEGDTVFVDRPETALEGDLVLTIKAGVHLVETLNEGFNEDVIGVILGCVKVFDRVDMDKRIVEIPDLIGGVRVTFGDTVSDELEEAFIEEITNGETRGKLEAIYRRSQLRQEVLNETA